MLWIPIRKTDQVNLSRSLEVFILKNYDKPTHERLKPFFTSLDESRKGFIEQIESNNLETAIQSMEVYLAGLALLESRIPISSTDIKFSWFDTYLKSKQPVLNFTLEKLSVMYSVASCWSKIGAETDLRTPNGHKSALAAYQNALNWLTQCKKFLGLNPVDQKGEITIDNMEIWSSIMIAQGYNTLYDKLDKQTGKKESIAKLAFSLFSNYERSISFLSNTKAFPKEQENILRFNSSYFEATGHFFQSLNEKDKANNTGSGFGLVVSRLKLSEKCLTKALQLRGIRGNLLESGKQLLNQITTEKSIAENENFTIYMERIPEETEILPLEPLNMIIPKEVTLRDFPYKDLILILVPAEILGIHKEFETYILSQFTLSKEKVDLCLQDLAQSLHGKTFEGIPEPIWQSISQTQSVNCEAQLEQMAKIKSESRQNLQQAVESLAKEESEDEELRKRYGPAWTRPSSATCNQEMKKELELLIGKLQQASDTDEKTFEEFKANKASLDLISLSKSDLDNFVPALDSNVINEKDYLNGEIQNSQARLVDLLNQYKEGIFKVNTSDDLKRIVEQKLNKDEVFEEINLEFNEFRDLINQEIEVLKAKQEKMLQLLASVSVEYRAAELLHNVQKAIEVKKNLAMRLEQGINFYGTLANRVSAICNSVKDFLEKRGNEKVNSVARMHHSVPAPVGNNAGPTGNVGYNTAPRQPSNIVYQPSGPQQNISYTPGPQAPPPQASPAPSYAQGSPSQPYPPAQGYPPQGLPPQGYPPQGYPPQGYSPSHPQPGYGQGYPGAPGYNPQAYPSQPYPGQGYPPNNPPQGYPSPGYPAPAPGYPGGYMQYPSPGQGYQPGYPPAGYQAPPNPFQQARK